MDFEDQELIQRARSGNREAFSELVMKHRSKAVSFPDRADCPIKNHINSIVVPVTDLKRATEWYKERTAEAVYMAVRNVYYPDLSYLHASITEVIRRNVRSSGKN